MKDGQFLALHVATWTGASVVFLRDYFRTFPSYQAPCPSDGEGFSMFANQWIDVHAHFTPPLTKAESDARWEARKRTNWAAPRHAEWTPEATPDNINRPGT